MLDVSIASKEDRAHCVVRLSISKGKRCARPERSVEVTDRNEHLTRCANRIRTREDTYQNMLNQLSAKLLLHGNGYKISPVVERDNLLDGNLLSRRLVKSGADDTVCALANNILDVILLADVEGDLAGSGLRRSARHCCGDVV